MIEGQCKAWRYVIEPRYEVANGKFQQSEFAADLGQVVRGEGSLEYTDPINFFERTYLTQGLKSLLITTLKRLNDGDGEPVIQLKTSFGGGKTHSLLALYHLFNGKILPNESAAVSEILNDAEISTLPEVHIAVISGTWTNPIKQTLWGEIVRQLSVSTGKPELYEMMRQNDEEKIAPGVELLKKIFDAAGSCLILIDELVSYGRKLRTGEIKSGGTFGNLMSFIQELTEAVKASPRSVAVASIPESDAEIIDDLGRKVLTQVEKFFGRMEFVWSPITTIEGYEIVRRRLFKECRDEKAKRKVCSEFYSMYDNFKSDFPFESQQKSYHEKLLACYPFHPSLFDYLYDKWTSLDGFQKTRGVLRLMANVIHALCKRDDKNALIMPGNLPIDFPAVREELAKLLKGNWNTIIDTEVAGEDSKPYELDLQTYRFNKLKASQKITRTIFMGTAPVNKKGNVHGISESEIRLSVIQPNEINDIAVYNDALTKLKENLYYLYSQDTRLWFGVIPTLRKLVDDERGKFSDDDLEYEIEQRLRKWKSNGKFKAVHICPKNSSDVPDEQTARLVILSPKYFYTDGKENDAAINEAKKILDNRGNIPRNFKNTLLFMAADTNKLKVLKDTVRNFLAWQSINKNARHYNLDISQIDDAKNQLKSAEENFAMKTSQAYCKIFLPERKDAITNPPMEEKEIECTKEDNISVAYDKFTTDENLIDSIGCLTLRTLLDEYNIWQKKDCKNITLIELWDCFVKYYYMPCLTGKNVLFEAVRKGIRDKIFAVAEGFQDGKYINLKFGDDNFVEISDENFLVKASIAEQQIESERQIEVETPKPEIKIEPVNPAPSLPLQENIEKPDPLSTHFSLVAEIDSSRYKKELGNYIEDIASIMMNLPNANTSIKVTISIDVPDGIPIQKKKEVLANCKGLKIPEENFHFE